MRSSILIAILFACLLGDASLAASADLPAEVASALKSSGVEENGDISPLQEADVIQKYMMKHWQELISPAILEFKKQERHVLYAACGELEPSEYLELLEKGKALHEAKTINDEEFIALNTPPTAKEGFIIINLRDPRVQIIKDYLNKTLQNAGYPSDRTGRSIEEQIEGIKNHIDPTRLARMRLPTSGSDKSGRIINTKAGASEEGQSSAMSSAVRNPKSWVLLVSILILGSSIAFTISRKGVSSK